MTPAQPVTHRGVLATEIVTGSQAPTELVTHRGVPATEIVTGSPAAAQA